MKRWIALMLSIFMLAAATPAATANAAVNYYKYSNKKHYWWLNLNNKHAVPTGPVGKKILKQNDAFYCGLPKKDDKVIYLTFDCGYENGQTKRILDTLKKARVQAMFFVTTPYIKENPKLVKRMKKEGHLVGNHTTKHKSMPNLSPAAIKSEILTCQRTMKKLTGYKMDPFIRPPMGEFSLRSLKVSRDLGYTTILWSYAYYDYEPKAEPGKYSVINKFKGYHHNGMLPLMHAISRSNAGALPTVIKNLKKSGYRFGSLYELPGQNQQLTEE